MERQAPIGTQRLALKNETNDICCIRRTIRWMGNIGLLAVNRSTKDLFEGSSVVAIR